MPTPLKAIIFDYGNVLSEPQNAEQIQAMASVLDLPHDEFVDYYWRFRVAYDEAQFEPVEYWKKVAALGRRALTRPQIDQLIELDALSWMNPRRVIADWARALRQSGLRTALLSNMPVTLRDALRNCTWLPDFDWRTFSCDIRVSKPAPEIYQDCLQGLAALPGDVLFLDDREPNVRGAQQLGMHALQFTTIADLSREIKTTFDLVPLQSF